MALNIANRRVEKKAILASKITNVNKTAAVEIALDYYLANYKPTLGKSTAKREVENLFEELTDLPILDKRDADDILGYDGEGLV